MIITWRPAEKEDAARLFVQLVFSTGKSIGKYPVRKINTWTTPRLLSLRSADSPPVLNSDHTLLSTRFYVIVPQKYHIQVERGLLKTFGRVMPVLMTLPVIALLSIRFFHSSAQASRSSSQDGLQQAFS